MFIKDIQANYGAGWVSIYRSIEEHWVWKDDKIFKIWIYFLLMANHKDNKFIFDGRLYNVNRGSFITSLKKLSEKFHCSIGKIRRILILFQNDMMIDMQTDTKKTQITICNYDSYQNPQHAESTPKAHQRKTDGKQTETNNNDNNENNECDTETARTLIIKTLGVTKPAYVTFATEIITKFGQDKARQIFREFADKGFNVVQTMRESLDENGNIIPKNLKNTLLSEITYSELIKLSPTDQTKYERLESGKWKLKA